MGVCVCRRGDLDWSIVCPDDFQMMVTTSGASLTGVNGFCPILSAAASKSLYICCSEFKAPDRICGWFAILVHHISFQPSPDCPIHFLCLRRTLGATTSLLPFFRTSCLPQKDETPIMSSVAKHLRILFVSGPVND